MIKGPNKTSDGLSTAIVMRLKVFPKCRVPVSRRADDRLGILSSGESVQFWNKSRTDLARGESTAFVQ
jgi:hypothetical protein